MVDSSELLRGRRGVGKIVWRCFRGSWHLFWRLIPLAPAYTQPTRPTGAVRITEFTEIDKLLAPTVSVVWGAAPSVVVSHGERRDFQKIFQTIYETSRPPTGRLPRSGGPGHQEPQEYKWDFRTKICKVRNLLAPTVSVIRSAAMSVVVSRGGRREFQKIVQTIYEASKSPPSRAWIAKTAEGNWKQRAESVKSGIYLPRPLQRSQVPSGV